MEFRKREFRIKVYSKNDLVARKITQLDISEYNRGIEIDVYCPFCTQNKLSVQGIPCRHYLYCTACLFAKYETHQTIKCYLCNQICHQVKIYSIHDRG